MALLIHCAHQTVWAPECGLREEGVQICETSSAIAIYVDHAAADQAIKGLQKFGFDLRKLSIVVREYHPEERVVGYYNSGDRVKYWAKLGAFWGGLWGFLIGAGFFAFLGISPVLAMNPLLPGIVGALEGAVVVGGLSAIGAGLYSIGIPKDSILKYETGLRPSGFVLIARGTADEIMWAKNILQTTGPSGLAGDPERGQ